MLSRLRGKDQDSKRPGGGGALLSQSGLSGQGNQIFYTFCQPGCAEYRRAVGSNSGKVDRPGLSARFRGYFELGRYRKEIVSMEGFGEKSFENLMESIEKARHTTLPRLIYGLGIPNVGAANAKLLCRRFGYDLQRIEMAKEEELCEIEGVGK